MNEQESMVDTHNPDSLPVFNDVTRARTLVQLKRERERRGGEGTQLPTELPCHRERVR